MTRVIQSWLQPKKGTPVGAGLVNMGKSCFLNSVLQCLTHTPPLVKSLNNTPHTTPCAQTGFCAFCALRHHVNKAWRLSRNVMEPFQMFNNLCNLSPSFQKFRQQDAHEYMHCLLEALHKSTLSPQDAEACTLLQGESFVKQLFGGRLRSRVRCMECSHCSDNFDPVIDLSLEINNASTLAQALEYFTGVETVEYHCQNCKHDRSASKQLTIDRAPQILLIQLKRFDARTKLQKKLSYPLILELNRFAAIEENSRVDLKYELYGVLVHRGFRMNSGHYETFVKSSSSVWHKFNDAKVSIVDEGTVLQQQAYILFYFRRGSKWFPASSQ